MSEATSRSCETELAQRAASSSMPPKGPFFANLAGFTATPAPAKPSSVSTTFNKSRNFLRLSLRNQAHLHRRIPRHLRIELHHRCRHRPQHWPSIQHSRWASDLFRTGWLRIAIDTACNSTSAHHYVSGYAKHCSYGPGSRI